MFSFERYYEEIKNNNERWRDRYPENPKKAAIRMLFWNTLFLFKKREKDKAEIHFHKQNNSELLDVAFFCAGGYGDYLLFANYLSYFVERFCTGTNKIRIYVFYHINSAKTIFDYQTEDIEFIKVDKVFPSEDAFDLTYKFCVYPEIVHADEYKVRILSESLYNYVLLCKKFVSENALIFEKHPQLDGLGTYRSMLKGIKRIQEPDLYGFLGIEEKYHYNLKININEDEYLRKYDLQKGKYITIHRGWDGNSPYNVKAWSLETCGDLIPKLKETFPEYKLVLIGADSSQAPINLDGLDINLIGKTSLEEVKVLLKRAKVHIDNEGGMVHLRHAVDGGKSVVLFGATSEKVFGYSENINIKSKVCTHFCEWMTDDWPNTCPITKGNALCMDAITPEVVVDACNKILKS